MYIRVSELLGIQVVDRHGRSLGQICDLIVDHTTSGALCYAMLLLPSDNSGGPGCTVAVPWSLLAAADPPRDTDDNSLMLDVSASALRRLRDVSHDQSALTGHVELSS